MKMLAVFDGVFAVSQRSSILLEEYWEWLGYEYSPSVKSLQLGADGLFEEPTVPRNRESDDFNVLLLGIIEVRKGHDLALDACERLWDEGFSFKLHVVGRANPHFGREIEKRIRKMERAGRPVRLHGHLKDKGLQDLFQEMDLCLFPSRAEGCGLPVLESLWKGLPVLCSRLKSVQETSRFGGCRFFAVEDSKDLAGKLKCLVKNEADMSKLRAGIKTDMLPRWSRTAQDILHNVASRRAQRV